MGISSASCRLLALGRRSLDMDRPSSSSSWSSAQVSILILIELRSGQYPHPHGSQLRSVSSSSWSSAQVSILILMELSLGRVPHPHGAQVSILILMELRSVSSSRRGAAKCSSVQVIPGCHAFSFISTRCLIFLQFTTVKVKNFTCD